MGETSAQVQSPLEKILLVEPGELRALSVQVTIVDFKDPKSPVLSVCHDLKKLCAEVRGTSLEDRWFNVQVTREDRGLCLQDVLVELQKTCELEPYSVRDALTISTKTKVDHDDDSLYVSMLTFNIGSTGTLLELLEARDHDDHLDAAAAADKREDQSHSILSALAKRIQPSWERVALFLTPKCVVTVFYEPDSKMPNHMMHCYSAPNEYQLERSKGPDFLYFKLLEDVVNQVPKVLERYRKELFRLEQVTFNTQRPRERDDTERTKQLHLMSRELSTIAHFLDPALRVLETILSLPADTSAKLIDAETLDCLEEVQDDVDSRLHELGLLCDGCVDLMDLMFNLSNYRGGFANKVFAAGITIFVPLGWWCGIFGSNWIIFPELTWGVDKGALEAQGLDADGVPYVDAVFIPGWPGGYTFFLAMQGLFFVLTFLMCRYLRVL